MLGTLIPPSNLHIVPLAYPFSIISLAHKANQWGWPSIPNGITDEYKAFFIYAGIESFIGVSNIPGAIVITLTFFGPKSRAIGKVIALIAPFVAE